MELMNKIDKSARHLDGVSLTEFFSFTTNKLFSIYFELYVHLHHAHPILIVEC